MAWTRRYAEAEPQRVNRWLAQSGVCSRREAEALIAKGLVSIDGEPVADPGRKIITGQTLVLSDEAQGRLESRLSVMVHKPVGVVSSQPEAGQIPAVRLLTRKALWRAGSESERTEGEGAGGEPEVIPGFEHALAPVGRLDRDSRGLLILSEDGVLAKAVIGPASDLEKEYLVQVEGAITHRKLTLLRHGLQLDGRTLKPAKVSRIGDLQLRFVLKEGRNRQIRRMCELVELRVVDLLRIRVGAVQLGELPEGRWRPISASERASLLAPAMAAP